MAISSFGTSDGPIEWRRSGLHIRITFSRWTGIQSRDTRWPRLAETSRSRSGIRRTPIWSILCILLGPWAKSSGGLGTITIWPAAQDWLETFLSMSGMCEGPTFLWRSFRSIRTLPLISNGSRIQTGSSLEER